MDPYGMALKWRPSRFLGLLSSTTCRVVGLQDGQWRLSNSRCSGHGRPSDDPGIARKAITGEQTRNAFGNTGLHEAAIVENFDVARVLVDFSRKSGDAYKNQIEAKNGLGETPVYRAAALGKTKVLQILTEQVGDLRHHFYGNDDKTVLHMAVLGQHFDTAIWLLKHDSSLANKRTSKGPDGLTCLQLLALMPSAFKKTPCLGDGEQNLEIFSPNPESSTTSSDKISIISLGLGKGNMLKAKKLVDFSAGELDELLLKKDCTNKGNMIKAKKFVDFSAGELVELFVKKDCTNKAVHNYKKDKNWAFRLTLLFAASNGITEILKEIIHQHPQAILLDNLNEKEQNILHVSVKRRQYKVFELIMKDMRLSVPKWASRIDKKGYTLLHHVADMKHYKEGTRPGPVLQFQEELQLFESVKEIMPRHYAMHRDENNKMTARDLFNITHEDQLGKAQEWIKENSQACSVLAILIATVVFTAAFTIPGGNNDKGFPHFLKSPLFYVFTVMDVASLALSLSSVVMFLSILTSPRESSDFLRELPRKLLVGFTLLFFSVLTSMITFSASLLLIIRMEKKWTAALYAAAIFPVIVLALMEFPYCADFLVSGKVYYLEFMNKLPWKKKKKKKKK
ncbi:hypothetical protein CUMW_244840 [Citrus unshiu]|uniref:PGG domain-containing protein n=1 Tax=Citrus unshiu TaxID=55188 RepID=A0A2H5QMU5_CITUN|nr:hypothetical protein CUMW_244840 [Citrus unshiu]